MKHFNLQNKNESNSLCWFLSLIKITKSALMAPISTFCSAQLFKAGLKQDPAALSSCSVFSWDLDLVCSSSREASLTKMRLKEEERPEPAALRVDTASLHSARIHSVSVMWTAVSVWSQTSMNWFSSAKLKPVGAGALKDLSPSHAGNCFHGSPF